MAAHEYHGSGATISLQTEDGTSITVGKARSVNIREQVEVDELYSADSIKRGAVKQRNFSVLVELGVAEFDVDLIHEFHGGSGGASSTGMVDDSDPTLYEVTASVEQHGQSTSLQAVVEEVYFDEMPIFSSITHDSWAEHDLSGVGKDITVTEV